MGKGGRKKEDKREGGRGSGKPGKKMGGVERLAGRKRGSVGVGERGASFLAKKRGGVEKEGVLEANFVRKRAKRVGSKGVREAGFDGGGGVLGGGRGYARRAVVRLARFYCTKARAKAVQVGGGYEEVEQGVGGEKVQVREGGRVCKSAGKWVVHVHNGLGRGLLPSVVGRGDEKVGGSSDCGWERKEKVVSVPGTTVRPLSFASTLRRACRVHFQEMEKGGGGVHGVSGRLDIRSSDKRRGVGVEKEGRERVGKGGVGEAFGEGMLGTKEGGGVFGASDQHRGREVGDSRKEKRGVIGHVGEGSEEGEGSSVVVGKVAGKAHLGGAGISSGQAVFSRGLSRHGRGRCVQGRLGQGDDGVGGDEGRYGKSKGMDGGAKKLTTLEKGALGGGYLRRLRLRLGRSYWGGGRDEVGYGGLWGGRSRRKNTHQGGKGGALHSSILFGRVKRKVDHGEDRQYVGYVGDKEGRYKWNKGKFKVVESSEGDTYVGGGEWVNYNGCRVGCISRQLHGGHTFKVGRCGRLEGGKLGVQGGREKVGSSRSRPDGEWRKHKVQKVQLMEGLPWGGGSQCIHPRLGWDQQLGSTPTGDGGESAETHNRVWSRGNNGDTNVEGHVETCLGKDYGGKVVKSRGGGHVLEGRSRRGRGVQKPEVEVHSGKSRRKEGEENMEEVKGWRERAVEFLEGAVAASTRKRYMGIWRQFERFLWGTRVKSVASGGGDFSAVFGVGGSEWEGKASWGIHGCDSVVS